MRNTEEEMNPFSVARNYYRARSAWLGDGSEPVSQSLADQRASVCLTCPKNQPHPIYENLAALAALELRRQIEIKANMKLVVPGEDGLHVCEECWCVLKLKVWPKIQVAAMNTEITKLPEWCWIRKEACAGVETK